MPWCTVVIQSNILIYRCGGSIGIAIRPIYGQAHRFPVSLLFSPNLCSLSRRTYCRSKSGQSTLALIYCQSAELINCWSNSFSRLQSLQSLSNTAHWNNFHTFNRLLGSIACRHNGARKAMLGCLAQTLLTIGHRANLTGLPHFAKYHQVLGQ